MIRREFITLLGGAAAPSILWPLAARAQQPAMPVVGFLNGQSPELTRELVGAVLRGLGEAGYVDRQSVAIEYRWAEGRADRLTALAADLVRSHVNLIVAFGATEAVAARTVAAATPIVFFSGGDPVNLGLVASLNRPGGNVTGVSGLSHALGPKQLELLRELVPKASVIAILINPTSVNTKSDTSDLEDAASAIGQRIHFLSASTQDEIDTAFATLVQAQDSAVLVDAGSFFGSRRNQLVALAAHYAVPAVYSSRQYSAVGGLASYGPSLTDGYRQVGVYAGRVLKGEKPSDLPVLQPTKFEMVINLKTAKTLGLTVPPILLALANEVIE
jgi:putative ABC transport system substrate-binding protein